MATESSEKGMFIEKLLFALLPLIIAGVGYLLNAVSTLNHQVTVLTSLPHYPWWKVPKDFAHLGEGITSHNGIKVIRAKHVRIESSAVAYADGERIGQLPVQVESLSQSLLTWPA